MNKYDHEDSYLRFVGNIVKLPKKHKTASYRCLLCNTIKTCRVSHVVSGDIKSCGCVVKLKPAKDLQGQVINNQVVVGYISDGVWRVKNTCGHTSDRTSSTISSCTTGLCATCSHSTPKTLKHGHSRRSGDSPTYQSWLNMKRRCYEETHNRFEFYGGKGVTVCERWKDSFENFLVDMGERKSNESIERIDLELGYGKDNCKWASDKEQANNKSNNILIEHLGETMSLMHWCDTLGINYKTAHSKFKYQDKTVENILGKGYTLVNSKHGGKE